MEENGPNSLPFGLEKFNNQVAGHSSVDGKIPGLLKNDEGFVLKPLIKFPAGDVEVKFYEDLQVLEELSKLRKFVPNYHGTLELRIHDSDVKFIKLQDVTRGFNEPCIMDIKVGAQTWEPSASFEKRLAEDKKYSSSKRAFGFCIPGYQVYDKCSGKLKKVGKDEGKRFTKDTLPQALKEFFNFNCGYSNFLINYFLQYLMELKYWWQRQTVNHFYSSSLLFLYDASMLKNEMKCQGNNVMVDTNKIIWIKLYCIDFAHTIPANNTLDLNYISGLTRLIELLQTLREC